MKIIKLLYNQQQNLLKNNLFKLMNNKINFINQKEKIKINKILNYFNNQIYKIVIL